jgi:hypothetical protein
MTDVTAFEDIPLPAQRVWDVIGDFGGIRKWAISVQDETLSGTASESRSGADAGGAAPGRIRTLTLGDGSTVREALIESSQFSYSYSLLDRPGMSDYRGTVAVIPLDPAHCRIVLITHLNVSAQLSDADITARYTRFLAGNLKAMKKALALA